MVWKVQWPPDQNYPGFSSKLLNSSRFIPSAKLKFDMNFTSAYTSFKLLPWDQPKIACYGPVTQLQKVLPCVLITNGRVSENRGCIFKIQRLTLCFHHVTKSEGRIISLNQLTAEFISTEAYGSPKCTTYPLQVDFEASHFTQLPLQLPCADS